MIRTCAASAKEGVAGIIWDVGWDRTDVGCHIYSTDEIRKGLQTNEAIELGRCFSALKCPGL